MQGTSGKHDPARAHGAGAARELRNGYYVNLGIGIPTLVANYIPDDIHVTLQSENGLLGIGPFPVRSARCRSHQRRQTDHYQPAGQQFLLQRRLFAMIRGGHVDLSILGGLEVSGEWRPANWMVPGKMVRAPAAMDRCRVWAG